MIRARLLLVAGILACGETTSEAPGGNGSTDVTGAADTGADVPSGDSDVPGGAVDASPEVSPDAQEDTWTDTASEDVWTPPVCTVGLPCDDGNACTTEDACGDDGYCRGLAYTCDDERACTDDECTGDGDCEYTIADGACLIANICYAPGEHHALNECVVCSPAESATEWVLAADGAPCGDIDQCLTKSTCAGGQCQAGLKACDDQNPCTDDHCDPTKGCVGKPNADPCDDGNACTQGDTCEFGECTQGLIPLYCDDGKPCTKDLCSPAGCVYVMQQGPCEDGTACTAGDTCVEGVCQSGGLLNCDDGNPCTIDTCDAYVGCVPEFVESVCCSNGLSVCADKDVCTTDLCNEEQGTCSHVANTAACNDGDACTGPDECASLVCSGPTLDCDDKNICTSDSCVQELGGCVYDATPGSCSDGNACTQNDKCVGGTCAGSALSCADGKVCTQDSCDPLSGCKYTQVTGACNDGNACTSDTFCTPQGCVGKPTNCDDANTCTNDSCNPLSGCSYQPIAGACDDGKACSTGDVCKAGKCSADTSKCGCEPTFTDVISHVTSLYIGTGGVPGQGLDIDKNAATCAPDGCSAGIDNQLSILSGLANPEIEKAFASGDLALLYEFVGLKTNGEVFTINFLPAKGPDDGCNPQTQTCGYSVEASALDPKTCLALVSFKNAKIVGNKLTAGGPGSTFPFEVPGIQGVSLDLVLGNAQINATVTIAAGKVTAMSGILGGAVAKETFLAAIDAVDESGLPPGLDKNSLKGFIEILIQNDIDTNGDGQKDAASIGLTFAANQGTILGVD